MTTLVNRCQADLQLSPVKVVLRYSPTETLVEFDFGCKFMFVTCKIEFYAAAISLTFRLCKL
jgi:hypothetical protein